MLEPGRIQVVGLTPLQQRRLWPQHMPGRPAAHFPTHAQSIQVEITVNRNPSLDHPRPCFSYLLHLKKAYFYHPFIITLAPGLPDAKLFPWLK